MVSQQTSGKEILIFIGVFFLFLGLYYLFDMMSPKQTLNKTELEVENKEPVNANLFYYITPNSQLYIKTDSIRTIHFENSKVDQRLTNVKTIGDTYIFDLSNLKEKTKITLTLPSNHNIITKEFYFDPARLSPDLDCNFAVSDSQQKENVFFVPTQLINYFIYSNKQYQAVVKIQNSTNIFPTNNVQSDILPKTKEIPITYFCVDGDHYASQQKTALIKIEERLKSVFILSPYNLVSDKAKFYIYLTGFDNASCGLYINDVLFSNLNLKASQRPIEINEDFSQISPGFKKINLVCNKDFFSNPVFINKVNKKTSQNQQAYFYINNGSEYTYSPLVQLDISVPFAVKCRIWNQGEKPKEVSLNNSLSILWLLEQRTGLRKVSINCFNSKDKLLFKSSAHIKLKGPNTWTTAPYNLRIIELDNSSIWLKFKLSAQNAEKCRFSWDNKLWTDWYNYNKDQIYYWNLVQPIFAKPPKIYLESQQRPNLDLKAYIGNSYLYVECKSKDKLSTLIKKAYSLDLSRYPNTGIKADALQNGSVLFRFENISRFCANIKIIRKGLSTTIPSTRKFWTDIINSSALINYTVQLIDAQDNILKTEKISVLVDTEPPVIHLTSPIKNKVYSFSLPVSFSVHDNFSKQVFCEISINNHKQVYAIDNNYFNKRISIPSSAGPNYFYIRCYDENGNIGEEQTIYFKRSVYT